MEFTKPSNHGFTMYSKSGCINCLKIKKLLQDKQVFYNIIDCDDYLIEHKEDFLFFIKEISCQNVKTFPIVFNNGTYIGGFAETIICIDKFLLDFEENFTF